jgi:hypothetical protein
MKARSVVTLLGLAISFVLPAFAQQKEAVDPQTLAQLDVYGMKYSEAYNNVPRLHSRDASRYHEGSRRRSQDRDTHI